MRIHLPNSAWLGNLDPFLRQFDPHNPEEFHITANKKWISVHPMILVMIASLGQIVPKNKISCEALEARSKHYFERMGLFQFLGIDSGINVVKHESEGRFVPITQIKTSAELTRFIT